MFDFTGPVTINVAYGPTLDDISAVIAAALSPLEQKMTDISDFLDGQNATLETVAAKLTDVASDVTALLARAGEAGVFTTEEQTKADQATATLNAIADGLTSLDVAVGDEDGSDTVEPPVV